MFSQVPIVHSIYAIKNKLYIKNFTYKNAVVEEIYHDGQKSYYRNSASLDQLENNMREQ